MSHDCTYTCLECNEELGAQFERMDATIARLEGELAEAKACENSRNEDACGACLACLEVNRNHLVGLRAEALVRAEKAEARVGELEARHVTHDCSTLLARLVAAEKERDHYRLLSEAEPEWIRELEKERDALKHGCEQHPDAMTACGGCYTESTIEHNKARRERDDLRARLAEMTKAADDHATRRSTEMQETARLRAALAKTGRAASDESARYVDMLRERDEGVQCLRAALERAANLFKGTVSGFPPPLKEALLADLDAALNPKEKP